MEMTSEQRNAAEEFRHCAHKYVNNPCQGTLYPLDMAAEECRMLGLDPEKITPDGYDERTLH
jgi:hypothetical protein